VYSVTSELTVNSKKFKPVLSFPLNNNLEPIKAKIKEIKNFNGFSLKYVDKLTILFGAFVLLLGLINSQNDQAKYEIEHFLR